MAHDELAYKDKELIALGAGVAAGCLPCSRYHLRKATEAGSADGELKEAVSIAAGVRQQAALEMAWQVRRSIGGEGGPRPETDPAPAHRLASLVALGAAYAANSPPLLKRSVEGARAQGASHGQMIETIEIARAVKGMAMTIVDGRAGELLGAAARDPQDTPGCAASSEAVKACPL